MKRGFEIKMRGDKKATILLYEDIGEGWLGGIGAKTVAEQLNKLGKLDEINVRINSPGGSVFDGVAIYNTLINNQARIVVDIDGLAASIASVIAMAGDEIRMADNALFMIHDPWTLAYGTAQELRDTADRLDKVRDNLVTTYINQTKLTVEEVSNMMSAETWMNAQEALDKGFITEITGEQKMAAMGFNLSRFHHVPEQAKAIAEDPESKEGFQPKVHPRLVSMRQRLLQRAL